MMMRLLAGLWICIVALGTSFGVTQWKLGQVAAQAETQPVKKAGELRKLKSVTIPMVASGQVQGYLVAQFSFMVDNEVAKGFDNQPDLFVSDEAFRLLYADKTLDFKNLERFDIPRFAAAVKANVNARLKADVVVDILVQEFNYIGAEDVRK